MSRYTSLSRALQRQRINARYSSTLSSSSSKSKTIFSGIQPTGVPHLGNLLGALSNWVELQNKAAPNDTIIYSTVGYHAITMPQDPKVLREARLNSLACLLAVGINPKRSILFLQDQIPEHAELAWILNCITPMGKLQRMTTWKSKLAVSRNANSEDEVSDSLLNLGLFAYPVLQTADILLYKATHVPVGEDQQQHLELSRDLADLFNRTNKSNIFPLPQHIITPAKRILSLRDPTQKMSKSAPNPKSRILITDDYSEIQAKIRSAVTDSMPSISYDPENRPGVANLLTILAACSGTSKSVPELAQEYSAKNHAELKADVTEAVERLVGPIRENYRRIRDDEAWLREVSSHGIRRAREIAARTMEQVKHQIGLGPL